MASTDTAASTAPQALVDNRTVGVAPVKAEYLISNAPPPPTMDDDAAEQKTNPIDSWSTDPKDRRDDRDQSDPRDGKRQRTDERGGFNKKQTKEERKARQGQNKGRKFKFEGDESQVCWAFAAGKPCFRGKNCKMSHDIKLYLQVKPRDIHFEIHPTLNASAPHVTEAKTGTIASVTSVVESAAAAISGTASQTAGAVEVALSAVTDLVGGEGVKPEEAEDDVEKSTDQSFDRLTYCVKFATSGQCPQGWKCRFLGAHVERATEDEIAAVQNTDPSIPPKIVDGWKLSVDEQKVSASRTGPKEEVNHQSGEVLKRLRTRHFPYPLSTIYLDKLDPTLSQNLYRGSEGQKSSGPSGDVEAVDEEAMMNAMAHDGGVTASMAGAEVEGNDVKMRVSEKRRLDWRGMTYCAPLTTVGNLPFRRLVVDYGADITCGEMALAQNLIMGSQDEWALTQRHSAEKTFGVQVCGGKAGFMVPAAEAISRLCAGNVDFVDVNLGCPIDLVFQKGAGSALFDAPTKLGNILKGMNDVLGDIPLTVKFRTGILKTKNIAHRMVPRFAGEWGVSAMTLHGRSRQQRYSKLADWNYIKECADVLRDTCADAGFAAPPIFGNGDCFSAQSYYDEIEHSGVDGVMVARGALIKPWIFTEIKERREWDISATERLEGLRKYAEFGLSHWGTDTKGVNTTRRFLCEAQSFQHRYIPIGLLERMPPHMNERPPAYRGRSELENLLASSDAEDWVKISEMFLGKRSDDFNFLPKHKSNAYGTGNEDGNG